MNYEIDARKKVFAKANKLIKASGMTLEEIGLKMGHDAGRVRRSAWACLKDTQDRRLSTLESLATSFGSSGQRFAITKMGFDAPS